MLRCFEIDIPKNFDGPKFKTQLVLENDTLISILEQRQKHQILPSPPGGDGDASPMPFIPYSIGLSKRCDLIAEIYSEENELIGKLNDYFYLNQCKLKTINEHPDWTYCTNDKNDNFLPIDIKLTFSKCARDILYPIDNMSFLLFPDPNASNNNQGI